MQKKHGVNVAQNTTTRILGLQSADNLLEFHENNPYANTHFLQGDRASEVSISVNSAKRLIVVPVGLNGKEVTERNFKKIISVEIIKIEDYHE